MLQDKVQQIVAGSGDGPAVFGVMFYREAVGLRRLFEALVVVGAASGCVLDPVDEAVQMDHLMEQRGADIFNGSCQRSRTDIDLMGAAVDGYPGVLTEGEMSVCPGVLWMVMVGLESAFSNTADSAGQTAY